MTKKNYKILAILFISTIIFSNCQKDFKDHNNSIKITRLNKMDITKSIMGKLENKNVHMFNLTANNGFKVSIIEYGAIVSRILITDKAGKTNDLVLGYDTLEDYVNDPYYFGATIGRVANRIGNAKIVIDGITYSLAPNTLPDFGNNHLHGGKKGFNKVLWQGKEFQNDKEVGVVLTYTSYNGEEGYPGNLECKVTYSINNDGELKIKMEASTDKTTVVNFTHHSYFNLNGAGSGDVLDTKIFINADNYTPADDDLIPLGEISKVKDLPIDFLSSRSIGSQMNKMQMAKFKGYDLNYVLNHFEKDSMDIAARATSARNNIAMEVFTTQPCMHFYTSNFLSGKPGKGGEVYEKYGAFCFEPQGFPDATNHKNFESIILEPGEKYNQTIIYKFFLVE